MAADPINALQPNQLPQPAESPSTHDAESDAGRLRQAAQSHQGRRRNLCIRGTSHDGGQRAVKVEKYNEIFAGELPLEVWPVGPEGTHAGRPHGSFTGSATSKGIWDNSETRLAAQQYTLASRTVRRILLMREARSSGLISKAYRMASAICSVS